MLCATEKHGYMSRLIVTWAFYLRNATWAIFPNYHMVLKAYPKTANIGSNRLFDITSKTGRNKSRLKATLN